MEAKSFLNDYYLTPGRTGKWQIHTPTEAQGEGGGGGEVVMEPLPRVLICCLLWKAFDLLEFDNVRNTFETKEIEILTKAKMKHNIYLLQP